LDLSAIPTRTSADDRSDNTKLSPSLSSARLRGSLCLSHVWLDLNSPIPPALQSRKGSIIRAYPTSGQARQTSGELNVEVDVYTSGRAKEIGIVYVPHQAKKSEGRSRVLRYSSGFRKGPMVRSPRKKAEYSRFELPLCEHRLTATNLQLEWSTCQHTILLICLFTPLPCGRGTQRTNARQER